MDEFPANDRAGALAELRARVTEATGADRELDASLGKALGWYQATYDGTFIWNDDKGLHQSIYPTPFTSSLDAALALVERVLPGWNCSAVKLTPEPCEGYVWERGHVGNIQGHGPTPALALLSAMLAALSVMEGR